MASGGGSMKAEEVKAWLMSQGLVIEENTNHNLQELLRDGLVLCQLANRLKPRSAAQVSANVRILLLMLSGLFRSHRDVVNYNICIQNSNIWETIYMYVQRMQPLSNQVFSTHR